MNDARSNARQFVGEDDDDDDSKNNMSIISRNSRSRSRCRSRSVNRGNNLKNDVDLFEKCFFFFFRILSQ